jgi:glycine cleavage system aminomethyltransferase T/glycine/D-amino acid oxidase-like deaminating enzyme
MTEQVGIVAGSSTNNSRTAFPIEVDVVVVGGGIVGCSVLYHLAKAGCTSAVLVERYTVGSGTTSHSAAFIPPMLSTREGSELGKYSNKLYSSLEEETGQATGYRVCGHLNMATSAERHEELKRVVSIIRSSDTEVELIGPAETKAMWPLLNVDDVRASIWMPAGARVDPTDTCQALTKGAKSRGARICENTSVEEILVNDGRIHGVRTTKGTIKCSVVVNCAGLWGRELAATASAFAPMFACEHFYLLTDRMEGVSPNLPMLRDADSHLYVREDVGGLLVGCFEPNPRSIRVADLPKGPLIQLNEDWDHFEPMMANAIRRIPALAHAGARRLVNGPESFTIDHLPLMGESAEVRGLFYACGMNSVGMLLGGGVGMATAEWILKGRPPLDLWSHDVRRFSRFQDNVGAVSVRIPEVLARHQAINWLGSDYQTARGIRKSPFYGVYQSRGAYFYQRAGWERPLYVSNSREPQHVDRTFGRPKWFDRWAEEHLAARLSVAVYDETPLAKFFVQGRDAEAFLQRMCANDVAVAPGRSVYTAMLNVDGGIESDLTATRLTRETYLLVTGSQQANHDLDWLRRNLSNEEAVVITEVTSAYATLGIAGPCSRELMSRISPADFSSEAFPFRTAKEIEVGFVRCMAVRVSFTGELGWELYLPTDLAEGVLHSVLEAGADLGVRLCGTSAINSLRLEKGFRGWGHDIGPEDTPIESGLMFAVRCKDKQMFIGREAILKRQQESPARRLMSVIFKDDRAFPLGGEPIFLRGERVGVMCTASFGHTLGRAVGLGWIATSAIKASDTSSDQLEVEVSDHRYVVTAQVKAPYDPQGLRLRE